MPYIHDTPSPSEKSFFDEREERRRLHHDADVVIVGAGIVGCAIAVAMGKQGRSVILLEKSLKEPDRIVGELLQPGGVKALERLGLAGEHSAEILHSLPAAGLTTPVRLPRRHRCDYGQRLRCHILWGGCRDPISEQCARRRQATRRTIVPPWPVHPEAAGCRNANTECNSSRDNSEGASRQRLDPADSRCRKHHKRRKGLCAYPIYVA